MRVNWNEEGFTLVELMIVVAIIGILAAIAIPNFISYRNKTFCSAAESDANNVAASMSDYYAVPSHVTLDTGGGATYRTYWNATLSGPATAVNTVTISGNLDNITITVTDSSGRCPSDYQTSQDDWNGSNVFTKVMKNN